MTLFNVQFHQRSGILKFMENKHVLKQHGKAILNEADFNDGMNLKAIYTKN